jgi:hypothetical protein
VVTGTTAFAWTLEQFETFVKPGQEFVNLISSVDKCPHPIDLEVSMLKFKLDRPSNSIADLKYYRCDQFYSQFILFLMSNHYYSVDVYRQSYGSILNVFSGLPYIYGGDAIELQAMSRRLSGDQLNFLPLYDPNRTTIKLLLPKKRIKVNGSLFTSREFIHPTGIVL